MIESYFLKSFIILNLNSLVKNSINKNIIFQILFKNVGSIKSDERLRKIILSFLRI